MTSEDLEDLVFAILICGVCRLVKELQLFVVMNCKHSVNSVINPNPMCSH
jgi:hypothetical protein